VCKIKFFILFFFFPFFNFAPFSDNNDYIHLLIYQIKWILNILEITKKNVDIKFNAHKGPTINF